MANNQIKNILDEFVKYQDKVLAEAERLIYSNVSLHRRGKGRKDKSHDFQIWIRRTANGSKATNAGDESVDLEFRDSKRNPSNQNYSMLMLPTGHFRQKENYLQAIDGDLDLIGQRTTSKLQMVSPKFRGVEKDSYCGAKPSLRILVREKVENTLLGLGTNRSAGWMTLPIQVDRWHMVLIWSMATKSSDGRTFYGMPDMNSDIAIDQKSWTTNSVAWITGDCIQSQIGSPPDYLNRGCSKNWLFKEAWSLVWERLRGFNKFSAKMNTGVEKGSSALSAIVIPTDKNLF